MSEDRPRWLDPKAAADRRLAELIDAGRSEQPSAAQRQALAERLAETFDGPGPSGGGGDGGGSGGDGGGGGGAAAMLALPFGRWVAAAVLVAAAGSSAWWLGAKRSTEDRAVPPAPSSVTAANERVEPVALPAPPPAALVAAPTAVPAADAGAAQASASPRAAELRARRAQRALRRASEPTPAPAQPDPGLELSLLDAAERALVNEPTRALALADQHAQRFPAGQLVQERELLAIEALVRLRDGARAAARGRAFLARYAGSSHAPRVRALLREASAQPQPAPNPRQ